MAQKRLPDESEIADKIERLVAAALVGETQSFGILHPLAIETDGVGKRRAANQTHVAHLIQLMRESKGARRRDLLRVALGRHFQIERLVANQGMIVVDIAGEQKTVGRQDGDAFGTRLYGYGPPNAQKTFSPPVRF